MEKGAIAILAAGVAALCAGVARFVHLGNFSLKQGIYCVIAVPVALVLLLVADYTLHHARIVLVLVLAIVVFWCVASPSFCVGLGLALGGMVLTQARR